MIRRDTPPRRSAGVGVWELSCVVLRCNVTMAVCAVCRRAPNKNVTLSGGYLLRVHACPSTPSHHSSCVHRRCCPHSSCQHA